METTPTWQSRSTYGATANNTRWSGGMDQRQPQEQHRPYSPYSAQQYQHPHSANSWTTTPGPSSSPSPKLPPPPPDQAMPPPRHPAFNPEEENGQDDLLPSYHDAVADGDDKP